MLENLVRNAIEHGGGEANARGDGRTSTDGGESVVVEVGTFEGGFYVADNGVGIPEKHRESVFDSDYTTSSQGSGLGLKIVDEIASAHGWDAGVAESDSGGARFEFAGVEFE